MTLQTASIFDLKISDRPEDANLYTDHKDSVDGFREACIKGNGLRVACLESFQTADLKSYLRDTAANLQKTVRSAGFYDLGIVRNDMVSRWAQQAERHPIEVMPWTGKIAVFVATHPDEVTFDKTLSVYMLEQIVGGMITLTEFAYIKASNTVMVYQSLVAKMPLGSSLGVRVIAYSEQPSAESVSSTLNPALMCTAFLASQTSGKS